ncbi:MAG: DUF2059 domain-containing protein [Proteobacteria bacterium]|nr:DUF2059 domain-containing protein [Pseudomonadota bacterium]
MKFLKAMLLVAIFAFAPQILHAQDQGDFAARQAAAKEYTDVVSMSRMMLEMSQEVTKQMPPDKRDDFIHMMTKEIDLNKIQSVAQDSLAKNFTLKELNAMTAYAKSPEGASAMRKMKLYMADIMPVMQSEIRRVMDARAARKTP